MSKESKTARASAVKTVGEKKVIPDADLIKGLRNDRASKLYPTVQGTDALLRQYDLLLAQVIGLETTVLEYVARDAAAADLVKKAPFADQIPEYNPKWD